MLFRAFIATVPATALLLVQVFAQPTGGPPSSPNDNDMAPMQTDPNGNQMGVTEFGSFQVIRKIERDYDPPVLHAWPPAREATLAWYNRLGDFRMTMTDNGFEIELDLTVLFLWKGAEYSKCGVRTIIDPNVGQNTAKKWAALRARMDRVLRSCATLSKDDRTRMQADVQAAAGDFPAAVSAWKSVSKDLFGPSTRRCLKTKVDREYSPGPLITCIRHSAR